MGSHFCTEVLVLPWPVVITLSQTTEKNIDQQVPLPQLTVSCWMEKGNQIAEKNANKLDDWKVKH